ncbi:the Ing1 Phd finger in complex with A histone H3k4me3 peptide, partial [Amanita rubescens]
HAMETDEVEDEKYCFCGSVSYGEMIACDDDECEREWFHIACVGLTSIPQGHWYCSAC